MVVDFSHRGIQRTSDVKDLLRVVFKTEKQADIATKIVESIKKKREMYDYEMKDLARTVDCSEKWFYSRVLRALQKIGMVRKDLNRYYLSKDFANTLRRMERSWRDIV